MTKRIATRVKFYDAKRHFQNGGDIVVSEHGERITFPVTQLTTIHNSTKITWDDLVNEVRMWQSRYPNQRYYIVENEEN